MKQSKIVECIPNFSEGRRIEVVDAIVASIERVGGATLLDRTSDADHNRSVITFVGQPAQVVEAAYRAIATAAQLIDLGGHVGAHPRIGATDVVPFVPIQNMSMEECVSLAHELGQRVAEKLNIPVYLYEFAAIRPKRENLANIRRGGYEKLKSEIASNPDRKPDFGPTRIGSAGATVIGARKPLIAYNVYLSTDDVQIAKKIARTIRYSSGGLPYVKALGLLVRGRAQVSMNLTDFTQTPLHVVIDVIRREATKYSVSIHETELVGLMPQQAVVETTRHFLQLENFTPEQILENRIQDLL